MDRRLIKNLTTDANKEIAQAMEMAVIVEEKGPSGEEAMLADRLIEARKSIDRALDELAEGRDIATKGESE